MVRRVQGSSQSEGLKDLQISVFCCLCWIAGKEGSRQEGSGRSGRRPLLRVQQRKLPVAVPLLPRMPRATNEPEVRPPLNDTPAPPHRLPFEYAITPPPTG
jgi:hypothetical protein